MNGRDLGKRDRTDHMIANIRVSIPVAFLRKAYSSYNTYVPSDER